MSLLEALRTAGGIDIDGTFIRTFNLDEDEPEFAIDVNINVEDETVNYVISIEDIEEAVQLKDGSWNLEADLGDWKDTVNLTVYTLNQIK